jgi:TonB-dependent SusC/RagA subfamily outer membrane receptor
MSTLRLAQTVAPPLAVLALLTLPVMRSDAQEVGRVAGRVVSTIASGSADPVPGVTIRLPGLGTHQVTDERGRFRLESVPAGRHEIRAEVLGCLLGSDTVEVRRGAAAAVDFRLTRPLVQLAGLVVTGTAAEVSEVELPYAVGRLDPEDVGRRAGRTIADLIRGQFPGARVVQGSGLPGTEITIQFRGAGSISSGQQPLVVIDGSTTAGGLVDLNPQDVSSIRVLKGSAAAAQYGSRGQAGVIEITTRDGAVGGPAARSGPLVIVDGTLAAGGLAGVDPDSIERMEMATGPAAGVLFGARAVRTGAMRITTRGGSPDGRLGIPIGRCLEPGP